LCGLVHEAICDGKAFLVEEEQQICDGSFKDLLMLLKDMLSQGNTVSNTVYEATQIICLLGLEVQKIHECKNGCILYRGAECEDLEKFPICGLN
jgi:hypothetical protein